MSCDKSIDTNNMKQLCEMDTAHTKIIFSPFPPSGQLHTSDVLLQQKAPLHYNKQRNIRDSHLMEQRPVFQLDDEDKSSSVDTARDITEASSMQGTFVRGSGFPRYKKPLPAISSGGDEGINE